MRLIPLLFLLLMPLSLQAQIIVGDAIPQAEIAQAHATLHKASAKTLTLQPGEFEILEPAKSITGPLLWISSSDDIVQRIDVAAQQPLGLWMKRRGDTIARLHQFPARPFPWIILLGSKSGTSTLLVVRNGSSATEAPVVVDKLVVSVGGPAPVPPTPPVEDELTRALRAAWQRDQQAGKAQRPWLLALAGLYETASRDSLDSIKTAGELDLLLNTARQAAGIPEPDQALPAVRQRIRQELLTQLNIAENGATQPLTAEMRRQARQVLAHIAQALEALSL